MQMRRSIAMEEGHFAPGVAKTLQNISSVGNPWGLDPDERFKWAEGLDVPFAKEGEHYAKAMIKILKASGLSFAVMQEESCNAELARRVGEEYLFECQTLMNIENLRKYTFSRIVAHCPHCFNTLKNDFPDYEGGKFNVISHVRFIAEQLDAGRLPLVNDGTEETFAIHDACYLARYNQIINAPRFIIDKIKNLDYVNPKEWGCNTTCCGAGGGQFWSENDKGERLNVIRLKAIVNDTGAKNIATSCPFCLSMFDSAKSQDTSLSEIQLSDIAEIVAKHIK